MRLIRLSTYIAMFSCFTLSNTLPTSKIAERLSIQRITVGTRLNRARKKLREVLVKRFDLGGISS